MFWRFLFFSNDEFATQKSVQQSWSWGKICGSRVSVFLFSSLKFTKSQNETCASECHEQDLIAVMGFVSLCCMMFNSHFLLPGSCIGINESQTISCWSKFWRFNNVMSDKVLHTLPSESCALCGVLHTEMWIMSGHRRAFWFHQYRRKSAGDPTPCRKKYQFLSNLNIGVNGEWRPC